MKRYKDKKCDPTHWIHLLSAIHYRGFDTKQFVSLSVSSHHLIYIQKKEHIKFQSQSIPIISLVQFVTSLTQFCKTPNGSQKSCFTWKNPFASHAREFTNYLIFINTIITIHYYHGLPSWYLNLLNNLHLHCVSWTSYAFDFFFHLLNSSIGMECIDKIQPAK